MRILFILISLIILLNSCLEHNRKVVSSPRLSDTEIINPDSIREILSKIKELPFKYTTTHFTDTLSIKKKSRDSFYNSIIAMDTLVIPALVEIICDTTLTKIQNPCNKSNFTYGQLAFLLIDDIEPIPIALATGMQFDVFECGV